MNTRRYRHVDAETRTTAVSKARWLMDQGWSRTAAARAVAASLRVHPNTVSGWIRQALATEPATTLPALQNQVRLLTQQLTATQALAHRLAADQSDTGWPS